MINKNWSVTLKKPLKLYFYLTTKLLHLYTLINLPPPIIEIHNIIDYAYNINTMAQEFYKNFQKKFDSFQVFKKL